MPFAVGETVGPYRILEQLGQGGMATVYKAYHATLDRYVAIKVLHQAFLEDENFKARFLREARLVARLEHPNIVPVYDFSEHAGQPYLVMKFIEGETLKARMARGPLSAQEALDIVESVGAALSYAHRQGVLHRDVKPSNVILGREGNIYLADFGLARIAASSATLTSDMIIGTPQYIAPEQAMGKKDLDERTDIYSFGVMLYEIAVGRVPFSADTPFAIIHDHIYSPLPLPREVNPNVPENLERVLLKALAKEREDRYATVAELVDAFRTAWVESGIPDHPETLALAREALPPPPEAPTLKPDITPPAMPSTAASSMDASQPAPAAQRPWGWLSAAILALLALWTLWSARGPAVVVEPGPTAAAMPMTMSAPMGDHEAEEEGSAALREAQRAVQNNPNDPWAYYRLAVVLWNEDAPLAAVEQFVKAAEISGDDAETILTMAEDAAAMGMWAPAARLYYRATRILGVDTPVELWDALYEAIYESAADDLAPVLLDWSNWSRVDTNLRNFGQARYFYYQGEAEKAYRRLDDLYAVAPDFPPARFLEAEFALEEGRYDDARALLEGLQAEPLLADWMAVRVAHMLQEIP